MKSIERRFKKISYKNPYWSTSVCFALAIVKQNFNEKIISRNFNKLVDKEDYASDDKKAILVFLQNLSKTPEACQK